MTMEKRQVRVGDIYQDNDLRVPRRRLKVVEISGAHAVCEVVEGSKPGRKTKIDLGRLGTARQRDLSLFMTASEVETTAPSPVPVEKPTT
jgi:hypothetical protein